MPQWRHVDKHIYASSLYVTGRTNCSLRLEVVTVTETLTKDPKPAKVQIFIDGTKYKAPNDDMTGKQLRALAKPPIGGDRDLWLDIVDKLDELVEDGRVVHLEEKMRFFSVPKVINPGRGEVG